MLLNKNQWGKLCQFITGHNSLNRHLVLTGVDPELEAACSLCNEDAMTSAHIMGICPQLIWERIMYHHWILLFGSPLYDRHRKGAQVHANVWTDASPMAVLGQKIHVINY